MVNLCQNWIIDLLPDMRINAHKNNLSQALLYSAAYHYCNLNPVHWLIVSNKLQNNAATTYRSHGGFPVTTTTLPPLYYYYSTSELLLLGWCDYCTMLVQIEYATAGEITLIVWSIFYWANRSHWYCGLYGYYSATMWTVAVVLWCTWYNVNTVM